jgi:hypothetical protein
MPCWLGKIGSFCKTGDVSTAPDIVQLFSTPLAIVDVPEAPGAAYHGTAERISIAFNLTV